MSVKITEKDILYMLSNENRKRIVRYLRNKGEYASTHEISEATGIDVGKVGYHCRNLSCLVVGRKLVEKKISSDKALWKITEKGLLTLKEIAKREGKK